MSIAFPGLQQHQVKKKVILSFFPIISIFQDQLAIFPPLMICSFLPQDHLYISLYILDHPSKLLVQWQSLCCAEKRFQGQPSAFSTKTGGDVLETFENSAGQ